MKEIYLDILDLHEITKGESEKYSSCQKNPDYGISTGSHIPRA